MFPATSLALCKISEILDNLQDKKWISRMTSEENNRVQFLSLTPQGRRVLPWLATIADENDEHFFGALDPDEQTTLQSPCPASSWMFIG